MERVTMSPLSNLWRYYPDIAVVSHWLALWSRRTTPTLPCMLDYWTALRELDIPLYPFLFHYYYYFPSIYLIIQQTIGFYRSILQSDCRNNRWMGGYSLWETIIIINKNWSVAIINSDCSQLSVMKYSFEVKSTNRILHKKTRIFWTCFFFWPGLPV